MAIKLDKINGTDYIKNMLRREKLTDKHKKILQQQSAQMQDIIMEESEE